MQINENRLRITFGMLIGGANMKKSKETSFIDVIKTLTADQKKRLNDYVLIGPKEKQVAIQIDNVTSKEKQLIIERVKAISKEHDVDVIIIEE